MRGPEALSLAGWSPDPATALMDGFCFLLRAAASTIKRTRTRRSEDHITTSSFSTHSCHYLHSLRLSKTYWQASEEREREIERASERERERERERGREIGIEREVLILGRVE